METMTPNADAMLAAAERLFDGHGFGRLAGARSGLPFREAHHVTGALVAWPRTGKDWRLSLTAECKKSMRDHRYVFPVFSVENSVASRTSHGGTRPIMCAPRRGIGRKAG
jgi:argininosuccinate lyase